MNKETTPVTVPGEQRGVDKFFGTWPGNETDSELLGALDEIRKPKVEQRGNMPCAHEFVAVEIFYSVCKKCGQSESEVEQSPQPVDSNEVVTKRNQLEAQPLPAATQLKVDLHNPHPDEKFDAYRAALLEDYELLLSKYRALEAELSRLTSELSEAKAEHGKTLLLLSKAAFETIPELEAKLAKAEQRGFDA